jgi:hypothetical protein
LTGDADQADRLLFRPALRRAGGTTRMRRDPSGVVRRICIVRQFFSYKKICRQCLPAISRFTRLLSAKMSDRRHFSYGSLQERGKKACQNA